MAQNWDLYSLFGGNKRYRTFIFIPIKLIKCLFIQKWERRGAREIPQPSRAGELNFFLSGDEVYWIERVPIPTPIIILYQSTPDPPRTSTQTAMFVLRSNQDGARKLIADFRSSLFSRLLHTNKYRRAVIESFIVAIVSFIYRLQKVMKHEDSRE